MDDKNTRNASHDEVELERLKNVRPIMENMLVELFGRQYPGISRDRIQESIKKLLDMPFSSLEENIDSFMNKDYSSVKKNIELSFKNIETARSNLEHKYGAWSVYITRMSLENIYKAYMSLSGFNDPKDIGHNVEQWLLKSMEDGKIKHIFNLIGMLKEGKVTKQDYRRIERSIRELKELLRSPKNRVTPGKSIIDANSADISNYLLFIRHLDSMLSKLIDYKTQKAMIDDSIDKMAYDLESKYADYAEVLRDYDAEKLINNRVRSVMISVRLIALGLLLNPHRNTTRYIDEPDTNYSPRDYDAVAEGENEALGIVICLEDIWTELQKLSEDIQLIIEDDRYSNS